MVANFTSTTTINATLFDREELALGGLALLHGSGKVMATSAGPWVNTSSNSVWYSAGVYRYGNTSGDAGSPATGYTLYDQDIDPAVRASDLGDLVLFCDPAPIEIGNRVWNDTNGDGIQDPDEPPIGGVTVSLYDSTGTLLASAITDGNGEYYFSSGYGLSTSEAIYNVAGLNYNTTGYELVLDNAADYTTGSLVDFSLTISQVDSGLNRAARDSDAQYVANIPTIVFNTGAAGDNDHTYDIGFVPGVIIGDEVWEDWNENGIQDVGEPGVAGDYC